MSPGGGQLLMTVPDASLTDGGGVRHCRVAVIGDHDGTVNGVAADAEER